MRKRFNSGGKIAIGLSFVIVAFIGSHASDALYKKSRTTKQSNKFATKRNTDNGDKITKFKINLDKSKLLAVKAPTQNLLACAFKSNNGWSGWSVKIPGSKNIATPAVSNGKVFVGGGYGSYAFYCLDALTGKKLWQTKLSDDGPSAAVVEDGVVAFATESCTLFALNANTGKVLWKEWLGDPLMSQPAIANGKVYMAYPSAKKGTRNRSHKFLCANLKTGKHLWEKPITADIITAPVISEQNVYFTCMDGTSFSFNAEDGKLKWKKKNSGTSAPVVAYNKCIISKKRITNSGPQEGLTFMSSVYGDEGPSRPKAIAFSEAPYLRGATNGTIGPQGNDNVAKYKSMDASVGFSSAPAASNLGVARRHMGLASVAGAWGYQGAKAFLSKGTLINAQGVDINSVDAKSGKVRWKARAESKNITGKTQVFSPPSLGRENMYLVSGDGHLVSMRINDGKQNFSYNLQQPVSFQPAMDKGNMYLGTANGMVVCLKTGNPDVDGWSCWGGNAQHNRIK